jgi:hypothetical protein
MLMVSNAETSSVTVIRFSAMWRQASSNKFRAKTWGVSMNQRFWRLTASMQRLWSFERLTVSVTRRASETASSANASVTARLMSAGDTKGRAASCTAMKSGDP